MTGTIFDIQSFSTHDGQGIRTTVFLKGCNMQCYWCHNPESINSYQEIQFFKNKCISCGECIKNCPLQQDNVSALHTSDCIHCFKCVENCYPQALVKTGYEITVDELTNKIIKDKDVYLISGGGVTFTGGEPLLQGEFLLKCLKQCKKHNIHIAIETALYACYDIIERLIPYVDLFFCDIKSINQIKHIKATGVSNRLILENINKLSQTTKELCFRIPIIPGFNDSQQDMNEIASFIDGLDNKHKVQLLEFHGYCINKYKSLNIEYKAKNLSSPSKQKMREIKRIFEDKNIRLV